MIKKYSLVLIALLCFVSNGFGQILTFEFNSLAGNEASANSNFNNPNLSVSTITRGTGLTASNNGGRFNATSWATSAAIGTTDYMEFDITPNSGYQFNITSIYFQIQRSGTGPRAISLRNSLDGYSTNLDTEYSITDNGSTQNFTFTFTQANSTSAVTYRVYMHNAEATGGSGGIGDGGGDDIIVNGTVSSSCTDATDYSNLQFPTASPQTITVGDNFDVYAQTYEPGVTPIAGADANIEAWIGYSATNTNPNTWTNWVPTTFNVQAGNNDEYVANLGADISASGTYYYASRFRLNGCTFTYGGTGGNWNNDSVQLIVNPDQVDFCNVDYPKTGEVVTGNNFNVYAQAYEPGITDAAGQGANIEAWIGYNTVGINHQPWNTSGWTWVLATYDSDDISGNNDQYAAEISNSQSLTANTYYFASRFRLNGSEFSYGGIQADNTGNFWDGTNNNGTLNVYNPPNNATAFTGCFTDTTVDLTWDAPASGTIPDGYVVFAIEGATAPNGTKGDADSYTANSDFSIATIETPASLGKVVYKGTGTSATITGLTENQNYSFAVFAYKLENGTGWSSGSAASRILNNIAQDDIRNLTATPDNMQMTLNWLRPTPLSCWDEIVVFANEGAVSVTPSGDGSAYTENTVYSTPNQVVYKGTGTVRTITGLANGTNYCFKAYVRRGATWSDGVEICETPIITYCDATSNTDAFNTGVTGVIFNTINNTGTAANNTYVDYTNLSTSIEIGTSYDLSVNVNVDGNGTVYSRVWIDWNIDGDFNDSNEEYDLGTLYNPSSSVELDGATSESPLSIEVPTNAVSGTTRMRVAAKWNSYPTSCEDNYSGEIEDYTINVVQPANAEINIKGNNITIQNGFDTPNGLNNTLYGATDITDPLVLMPLKSFFISNLGLTTLNFTNNPRVEIIGDHPGDFTVTQQPAASINAGGTDEEIIIRFNPTTTGIRKAQVRIYNNDTTGSENPYIFDIQGTGTCSTPITTNIWPTEGPEDTEVTITSVTNLTGAYAELNGITMPIVTTTTSELVVTVPPTATDGNLVVFFSTGCSSTNSFNVIDTAIGGCENGSSNTLSDLFISEVTDATSGSSSYIEIYNGTPNPVNLSDYSVNVYNNGSTSASSSNNLTGTLASGGIYVVSIGTTSCTLNNLNVSVNQSFGSSSGINFNNNSADMIALYKTSTTSIIDAYGVFGSDTWSNGLGLGDDGVNFRRKNTATPLPSATFNLADWDIIDWTSCGDSDYINIGLFDFSFGTPPSLTLQPLAINTNCDTSVDLTVSGTEGVSGGLPLAYRWYYLARNDTTWTEITSDGGPYTGFNLATLNISFTNAIDVNGYQYYCQIRENSATCYTASNAVKISHDRAYWDGTWSSTPSNSKLTIIDANYDTGNGTGGQTSFDACNLILNSGNTITVSNTTYVNVVNNVTNYGTINIQTQGSFVQQGDGGSAGTYTNSGAGIANVSKTTAQFDSTVSEINYTYWSSPINDPNNVGYGELITNVFPTPVGNRRYYFMAQNFIDSFIETNNDNDNSTNPGQDDIDDNFNDWADASIAMEIGRGYAVTTSGLPPSPGIYSDNSTSFSGALNTGDITVPLYKNNNEINDNNWNFIGNPYPSAINIDLFFSSNVADVPLSPPVGGLTEGAIFLWSQSQPSNANNNGNEQINFAQSDYAIINRMTQTAGTSGITPSRFIPSGQGFFVAFTENLSSPVNSVTTGNVVFTNSMRVAGNNTQFFEANDVSQNINNETQNSNFETNLLWVNLVSDNGVFSQIAIGYADGATNADDGWSYDTPRNLSTGTYASLHSTIDSSDRQFAIQGKAPESLNLEETIPLGFVTSIDVPTIYTFSIAQLEGSFMIENPIFIKDKLLNTYHNLKESDYNFTSEVGEFNQRFEIVFTEDALSVGEIVVDNNALQIIELQNGDVQFKLSSQYEMNSIEIIDLLGRTLYKLEAHGNSQIFTLSNLSQTTYLAKVKLTNGHIITKKAIKRK